MTRTKVIIDADPGIDDAFAVLLSLTASPELDVIALTSSFGNCTTEQATVNCHVLLKVAESYGEGIDVVQGSVTDINGKIKEQVSSFVHGDDGFGNTTTPLSKSKLNESYKEKTYDGSAAQYISTMARKYPGEITVICLATATNIVAAFRHDKECPTNLKSVFHLGGAFFTSGNVNPAAEANIISDPVAADELYSTHGIDIFVVGLDVTHKVMMKEENLRTMIEKDCRVDGASISNKARQFLYDAVQFYLKFHIDTFGYRGVYQHDSVCMMAAIKPDLFQWTRGAVTVVTEGAARGKTILDMRGGDWFIPNEWVQRPKINVALSANYKDLENALLDRFN